MDQPTHIEIVIKGKAKDVQRAAFAAQRRIDVNTLGFNESAYVFDDDFDFAEKMDEIITEYSYNELNDGTAEYTIEQESYACIWEEDITEIAQAIIDISPNVEFHISAVITVTYAEGYDLCVDVDYVDGKKTVSTEEAYYEGWNEDEDWDEDE